MASGVGNEWEPGDPPEIHQERQRERYAKGSERQRIAVRMRDEGQTYDKIARFLHIGVSRARQLVLRGRKAQSEASTPPRACGDPLLLHGFVINCQRHPEHLGKHAWRGGIAVGNLGVVSCTIEWRWHIG